MPRIEFIRLGKPEKAKHLCEAAEKFFQEGRKVLITVLDENQGVTLDRFMWTWKKGSFLPHALDNGTVDCFSDPVVITTEERNPNGASVLIMGKPCGIAFIRQFEEVIDFAEVYDSDLAQQSRDRFRIYREAGFDPGMHQ